MMILLFMVEHSCLENGVYSFKCFLAGYQLTSFFPENVYELTIYKIPWNDFAFDKHRSYFFHLFHWNDY